MQVVLAAMDDVCGAGGSPADRDAVRATVMATTNRPTVFGPVSFDANGDRIGPEMSGYRLFPGDAGWTFTEYLH